MNEIWKDIPGYEGLYQVSNLGRVKSLPKEWVAGRGGVYRHNGKILSLSKNRCGYLHLQLNKNSKCKTFNVHQLVAMAFLNHNPCGMDLVIDHINNNKLDNRLENLQVVTQRENSSKDRKNKTSKYIGVSWSKSKQKWASAIYFNNKIIYLGYFQLEYEAYRCYKEAIKSINICGDVKVKRREVSSKYKGVSWCKSKQKWEVNIRRDNKKKHLGRYKDEYEAHLAYQKALKEYER